MRAFVLLAAVVAAGGLSERAVGAERKEFSVWNVFTGDPNREIKCEGRVKLEVTRGDRTVLKESRVFVEYLHEGLLDVFSHDKSKYVYTARIAATSSVRVAAGGKKLELVLDNGVKMVLKKYKSSFLRAVVDTLHDTVGLSSGRRVFSVELWRKILEADIAKRKATMARTKARIHELRAAGKEPVVDRPLETKSKDGSITYSNPWMGWRFPIRTRAFLKTLYKVGHFFTGQKMKRMATIRRAKVDKKVFALPSVTDGTDVVVTWLNHACALVRMNGAAILTDPLFTPHSLLDLSDAVVDLQHLPFVDAIVLSHSHTDHYHPPSLRKVLEHNRRKHKTRPIFVFAGKGLDVLVERDLKIAANFKHVTVSGMMWGDASDVIPSTSSPKKFGVQVVAVPVQHWGFDMTGGKLLRGMNKQLWCGFIIRGLHRQSSSNEKWQRSKNSVVFLGDTGYTPAFDNLGAAYKDELFLSLTPIGAYEPRNFYRPWHQSPRDAAIEHRVFGVKHSMGVHFASVVQGTTEKPLEPGYVFAEAAGEAGLTVLQRIMLPVSQRAKEDFVKGKAVAVSQDVVVPAHYETYTFAHGARAAPKPQ